MAGQTIAPNPALVTRRVVTGHDDRGRSIIASDALNPVNVAIWHPDFVLNEVWREPGLPADNAASGEPCQNANLEPTAQGNVVRIVHFPPDADYVNKADVAAGFAAMGESGEAAAASYADAPHPLMHRTNTVDYIVVISGEIYAVMEQGETLLRQGDVLIQRGTNHAWSNRSQMPCLVAAILNAAQPMVES